MVGSNALRPITDSEIEQLNRDGAVLLPRILGQDWVEVLTEGLEYAHNRPDGMSTGVGAALRIDQFPASHSPQLKQLLDQSPIAEIVGSALNAPIRFYMDQMFYKPAGHIEPSAWHQDTCYYNVDGDQLIRAWLCADPAPREVSMEFLRGSHRWNITYRPPVGINPLSDPAGARALNARFDAGETLIGKEAHAQWSYFDSFLDPALPKLPKIEEARSSFDILGWNYQPGDVILFHGNVVHSAKGGVDLPHPRRSHASLWAGPDVTYKRRRSQAIPDPLKLYDENPKDGQPLSEFAEVFPVAWAPH